MSESRIEKDSLGEISVAKDALWGAQTQRAINNFHFSKRVLPPEFIRALVIVKIAAAEANQSLGLLPNAKAQAIIHAGQQILDGEYLDQFPLDVFQTGSGTSTNMNANEVLSHLASATGEEVHANDHVNMSQSSNDTIPTAIHVSAAIEIQSLLLPALAQLRARISTKAKSLADKVKTGRTHLMDAMPITLEQELNGWGTQILHNINRITQSHRDLLALAQGGTAVGTGINAHPEFGTTFANFLNEATGLAFHPADDYFAAISSQDAAVSLSGQLKTLAVSFMKIANDLRWMNSGPLAGLGEIALPVLQPGSSIMPGKVNPVIPEAVAMVAAQVIGNDATIAVAGQSGNFQLNVMLPVIAYNLLDSITLLTHAADALGEQIEHFSVNDSVINEVLAKNPILVTALNPIIGYEKAANIAKKAYKEGRPVLEVAKEETDLTEEHLRKLLDPSALTHGGIHE